MTQYLGRYSPSRRLRPVRRRGRSDAPRHRRAQRRDEGCWCQDFRWRPAPGKQRESLRVQPDGKVLITDGPYLETKEHVGGFWVLEAADLDEALAWGRKAAVACRAPVEVRPFH